MTHLLLLAGEVINADVLSYLILGAVVIAVGAVLRQFKQPYIIAYILAGVLIGESGFGLVTDKVFIQHLGEFGLILLLFFIGMEISLPNFVKNWKVPTFGTIVQILASIILVSIIGLLFKWEIKHIIVLGFITSLSSSAVVIKLLQERGETETKTGQNVISILLMQDILIVPLLIITGYLSGKNPSSYEIILQLIGGLLIIGLIVWILWKKEVKLPLGKLISKDLELQIIFALVLCFGFAAFTEFFGLSAALGAFIGGLVVNSSQSTKWVHESLHSFRVIFVAIFFVSIGLLIDLSFIATNWLIVIVTLLSVYIGNHLINAGIIHYFGRNWKNSWYGGALLAQIGELGFVVALAAYTGNIISDFEYQLVIVVTSLTLLISPFWIEGTKKLVGYTTHKPAT